MSDTRRLEGGTAIATTAVPRLSAESGSPCPVCPAMMRHSNRIVRLYHVSSQYVPQTIAQLPLVTMFTAPNPGPMTLDGTNTFVVGRETAYVIDPGPDIRPYLEALTGWLHGSGSKAAGILLTHGHSDHTPGAARLSHALGRIPIWASTAMAEDSAHAAAVDHRFSPSQRFPVDGETLEVLATPGHTHDHVAFWLPGTRILFVGDTILGQGSSVIAPPDGDMALYMHTLAELQVLTPKIIAPGHGAIIMDSKGKISEYIAHRNEREQQILNVLRQGPATLDDLVTRMYVGTDRRLLEFARASVEAQLIKLEGEHLVHRTRCDYWRT